MSEANWKRFERRVAEGFSLWLSNGASKQVVARQALMGRMVERLYGDLAPHPDCPGRFRARADWFMGRFFVDAKRRRSFSIEGVAFQRAHPFWLWWDKITRQADAEGKLKIMVLASGRRAVAAWSTAEESRFRDTDGGRITYVKVAPLAAPSVYFASFDTLLKRFEPDAFGAPALMEAGPCERS